MYLAKSGVPIITKIDLTKPAAILNAITSELAPNALPVTGPTTNVTVPAPIVAMLAASVYPKMIATIAPTKKDKVTPINKEEIPAIPYAFRSSNLTP